MKKIFVILLLFVITSNLSVTLWEQLKGQVSYELKLNTEKDDDSFEKEKIEKEFVSTILFSFAHSSYFLKEKNLLLVNQTFLIHELHAFLPEFPPEV
jgi:hypothetical protein